MLSGDNGILQKATEAKTQTGVGQEKETIALAYNSALAKKVSNGNSSAVTDSELNDELDNSEATASGNPIIVTFTKSGNAYEIDSNGVIKPSTPKDPNDKITVAEAKTAGTIFNDNTILIDGYENEVVVPKGFKIANDSANNITGGIVIEDATYTNTIGSQFVWIPVGNVKGKVIGSNEVTTTNIILGRYAFEDSSRNKSSEPIAWADLANKGGYLQYGLMTMYNEELSSTLSQKISHSGGFYIGRYEARCATERNITVSNDKTLSDSNLSPLLEKSDGYIYSYITKSQAEMLSQNMYTAETNSFESYLISSYAWDTTMLFLQYFGESEYSIKGSMNTSSDGLAIQGTNNLDSSKQDNVCNVYDLASNYHEFTTEGTNSSSNPCTIRGGYVYNSDAYAGRRSQVSEDFAWSGNLTTFRPILYVYTN